MPTPWHQDISIVGPVCALAGLLVGVTMMVAVYVVKNKQQQSRTSSSSSSSSSSSTKSLSMKGHHQTTISMTNVAYPALDDGEEMPREGENPLTTSASGGPMPSNPKKLAQHLEKQALRSSVVDSTKSGEL